ncbi:MAG: transglycosylase domain-containing protein [Clostridia bacterium]|nr:transglycosylase domain-containing protein [Clostridia bacterium]
MKKFLKLLLMLLTIAIIIGLSVFIFFMYQANEIYQKALAESSIEERVKKIQSDDDYTKIDDVSSDFKYAIIAIEDHRFEDHGAVDFISIGRAIYRNITSRSLSEGGSTITQQLAKNIIFSQEQSLTRKIAEILAAVDIEKKYSKDEIIELYVNIIYYGDGYYGIHDASYGYFKKAPSELSFDEATLLAGIPNAPSVYSLSNNPDLARQRQKYVIQSMIDYGFVTEEYVNSVK